MNCTRLFVILFIVVCYSTFSLCTYAQQWKRFGELHQARHNFGAAYIGNGEILVAGGQAKIHGTGAAEPINSCEIINIYTRAVVFTDSMVFPRSDFPTLLTKDSNVIVIGGVIHIAAPGVDSNKNTAAVEMFDRGTHRWKTIGSLLVARRQHAAEFINDEEILVSCGRIDNLAGVRSAEIFNIRTGQSRRIADYPYPLNHMTVRKTQSGRIIAFGGREGGPTSERYNEVYEYKPEYDIWIQSDTIYAGVYACSSLRLWDGHILLCGGSAKENPPSDVQLMKGIWIEKNNALLPFGTLQNERATHSIIQMNTQNLIVSGGTTKEWIPTSSSEMIDIRTGASTPLGSLLEPHAYHQSISVPWRFGTDGLPLESMVLCISGVTGIIHDDRGNHRDVLYTPLIEILENPECGFTTLSKGFYNASVYGCTRIVPVSEKDTLLALTPNKAAQTGAFWSRDKLPLADGFRSTFAFMLSDGTDDNLPDSSSAPGGDGFAFVIHNASLPSSAMGTEGKGLGYAGIPNSLAIEFDMYKNGGNTTKDPNGNHIAVQTNGKKANSSQHRPEYTLGISSDVPLFQSGGVYYAVVEYKDYRLRVYVDTAAIDETKTKPAIEIKNIDLESLLELDQGSGYVGFTAATGHAYQKQHIRSLQFEQCKYK